jgi:hypothetical protein
VHRVFVVLLLTCLLATPLAALDQRGYVYLETRMQDPTPGLGDKTSSFLWLHTGWVYAFGAGAFPLIYKYVPFAGLEGHFLIPAADQIVFHYQQTVSVWDGVPRYYTAEGKGYDDIFSDDTELTEIAPMRSGHFLVAERSNDRARGAKLIEFTVHGRVAEYRFPELVVNDKALGAMHIEVLADQCTVLYTLGNDDPAGNRVRRFNICTRQAQSDFAALVAGEYAGSIRQMANGDVIVANGSAVLEFTSRGSLVRTYQLPGVTHLALATDGKTFWAGAVNLEKADLHHFDPATSNNESVPLGNPEAQFRDFPVAVDDLVVVNEWRAATSASSRLRAVH